MKKILLAMTISLVSFAASANGYCNGKPTQAERDNCYRVMNSSGNENPLNGMKFGMAQEVYERNHQLVKTTPKLGEKDRGTLLSQFAKFEKNKGGVCGGDIACMTRRYIDFNNKTKEMYQAMVQK